MQVDGDNPIDTGNRDEVGNQTCGDGLARGSLALLASVAVMRNDGADGTGGSALGGICHDEQLHERIVHVEAVARAHGLHDEHVGTTHAVDIAGVDLAVREFLELHVAELAAQFRSDSICQTRVNRTGENSHGLLHFSHEMLLAHRSNSLSTVYYRAVCSCQFHVLFTRKRTKKRQPRFGFLYRARAISSTAASCSRVLMPKHSFGSFAGRARTARPALRLISRTSVK